MERLRARGLLRQIEGHVAVRDAHTIKRSSRWPVTLDDSPVRASWTQVLRLVVRTKYTREIRSKQSATSDNGGPGAGMGDKGGKKDKEKRKQQQVTKEKQEVQRKQEKARPKTP